MKRLTGGSSSNGVIFTKNKNKMQFETNKLIKKSLEFMKNKVLRTPPSGPKFKQREYSEINKCNMTLLYNGQRKNKLENNLSFKDIESDIKKLTKLNDNQIKKCKENRFIINSTCKYEKRKGNFGKRK
jgi:hypothetical protein